MCLLRRAVGSRFGSLTASPLAATRCSTWRNAVCGRGVMRIHVICVWFARRCQHCGVVNGRVPEHVVKHPKPTWLFPLQALDLTKLLLTKQGKQLANMNFNVVQYNVRQANRTCVIRQLTFFNASQISGAALNPPCFLLPPPVPLFNIFNTP